MHNRISSTRRFVIGDQTVTFAAGLKHGKAVVVFGVLTGLDAIPAFTLEKEWKSTADADFYVHNVTIAAAQKFLTHYQEHHQRITEQVNAVFVRPTLGFIVPEQKPGRYQPGAR